MLKRTKNSYRSFLRSDIVPAMGVAFDCVIILKRWTHIILRSGDIATEATDEEHQ